MLHNAQVQKVHDDHIAWRLSLAALQDDEAMWDTMEESESASEDEGIVPGMLTAEYFLKK